MHSASLPVLDHSTVQRTRLANGLTVLVRRDSSAPVAAAVTYVKAGYFDETDDIVGIAHVLEHMYFKGTARRGVGEIARETKASGGYLNAGTIYDHTSYYVVLPSSGFEAGLEVQADAYASSVIDAAELAKELEVIIQEAKRKADNPGAVATETLYELLHDRHRMRRWRIGREPGLRALTREQLVGFYRNFYRPRNTILSIVGDIDPDTTLALVERLYGGIPDAPVRRTPGPSEPDGNEFRYREWTGDIAQTQLVMGWRTPGTMHPDTPLLDLAAAVLGTGRASRLYRAVRERQLVSSITSYNYTPTDLGVFAVHAEAEPERTLDAACAIWSELRDAREAGIGAHELERARRVFEARWIRRLESMEGQANFLADWEALGDWTLGDRYLEHLMVATPQQVTAALGRYIVPDRAGIVVYRPERSAAVAADAVTMRQCMEKQRSEPQPPAAPRTTFAIHDVLPAPELEGEEAGVRVYRTPAGVPILVRARSGAPMVHIGVHAAGGASLEPPDAAGISGLLARTMLKGTERRTATQIAEDAELLGGSIGVAAGMENMGWSLSVPAKHAAAAIDLLADVIQHATIPEDALEIERAVAISDIRQLRDDMYRYPMRLALEAAFEGHPYGQPVTGTEETLAAITAAQVRDWHRTRAVDAPLVVAIVGDVDPDETAALAAREFAELRASHSPPLTEPVWPAAPVQRAEQREKAQTALALFFPGPRRDDEARHAAHLLAGIASGLGGRFFDELRDRRSLAYTVHAFAMERRLAGSFGAYIATSPEQEEDARRGLLAEFAKLRESPVREEELERAKTYALGTRAIRLQSGGAVLGEAVDAWLFGRGLSEIDELEGRIRAVTPGDILRLAREYFDESRLVEGVVRGVGKAV
ncbi:MAG TPA: pitrilysin family protein [Gemmatimonadaceae bacterium]|nr:pitrilysin family protein [Gemmatimonadaceae bacterium]